MEELKDLRVLASQLVNKYKSLYSGKDIELPSEFKAKVQDINGGRIEYNRYSAIVTTRANLNIFLPNQWFYIAAFFTEYYNELKHYRDLALSVFPKERLKELNGSTLTSNEHDRVSNLTVSNNSKAFLIKFVTDYEWWGGGKTIDRTDYFVSPVLNYAALVNVSQSYVADLCAFLAENNDIVDLLQKKVSVDAERHISSQTNISLSENKYFTYLTALRTKPFMLLAGISGTGKSRIVREMAKACWKPEDDEYWKDKEKQIKNNHPRNFCMVQVKPNWHDSSELIGYVTRISGTPEFVPGPFLTFMAKAIKEPEVPYFLCLDEMNLAPVEQYFAEYLSVIESRKVNKDPVSGQTIIDTDPIIKPSDSQEYHDLIGKLLGDEERMKGTTLTIPQNLFVVGTVNMDETTFSFSRKVLDRAMTIEMNEVDLHGGLEKDADNEIGYIGNSIIGDAAEGSDVYEENKELCDEVLAYLEKVNTILEGTPFKIAYRTRNEFLMYAVNRRKLAPDSQLWQTLDEMTSMKILSRIEGDSDRTKNVLERLKALVEEEIVAKMNNITGDTSVLPSKTGEVPVHPSDTGETPVFPGEATIFPSKTGESPVLRKSISAKKIEEMLAKLEGTCFTSYWS